MEKQWHILCSMECSRKLKNHKRWALEWNAKKKMELTKEVKTCTKSKIQKSKKNEQEETSGKEEG